MATAKTEQYKLYNGEVIIEKKTDEKGDHSYWGDSPTRMKKDGNPVKAQILGTTTAIKANIDKSEGLLKWQAGVIINFLKENSDKLLEDPNKILEEAKLSAEEEKKEAGRLGRAIHLWIEEFIKGENPEMPEEDKIIQGVNAFLNWKNENKVKFLESEKVVYNRKLHVCGIADIVAEVNGVKTLLDIKTGNAIYIDHLAQTANYAVSYNGEIKKEKDLISNRIILRISKEDENEYMERMGKKDYFQKNPDKIPPYKLFEAVELDNEKNNLLRDYEAFERMVYNYKWISSATKRLLNN